MADGHAFTSSDLASRRREVLDASRTGVALVRDTDGFLFAMMPAKAVALSESLDGFNQTLRALIGSLQDESPHPTSLGQVAFAADWSQARRQQLVADLAEAISVAASIGDPAPVAGLIEMSRPHPVRGDVPFDAAAAFAGLSAADQALLSGVRRQATANRPPQAKPARRPATPSGATTAPAEGGWGRKGAPAKLASKAAAAKKGTKRAAGAAG